LVVADHILFFARSILYSYDSISLQLPTHSSTCRPASTHVAITQHLDDLAIPDDTTYTSVRFCLIAPLAPTRSSRSLATARSHIQTKKVVLRLECTVCKVKHQLVLKRTKHFELGGDKKQVSPFSNNCYFERNSSSIFVPCLTLIARCRHLFLSSLYGLEIELGLEAGIDGPGILGMYWYETVWPLRRVALLHVHSDVFILITDAWRWYGGGTRGLIRGVGP
jgi:hypothetical protein